MNARITQIGWWYWFAMDILLALGLFGIMPEALEMAIVLGIAQSLHYWRREKRLTAFPVQVRTAYLGLLCLGMTSIFGFFHWIQLVGTTALLIFDYCPLARILVLAPWNRDVPLTPAVVWRTFVSPPVPERIKP